MSEAQYPNGGKAESEKAETPAPEKTKWTRVRKPSRYSDMIYPTNLDSLEES